MVLPDKIFRRATWRIVLLLTGLLILVLCLGIWFYQVERNALLEKELAQEQIRLTQTAAEMEFILAQAWKSGQYMAKLVAQHSEYCNGKVGPVNRQALYQFLVSHPTFYRINLFNTTGEVALDLLNYAAAGSEHYATVRSSSVQYSAEIKKEKIVDLGINDKTKERVLGFVYPLSLYGEDKNNPCILLIITSMHALLPSAWVAEDLHKNRMTVVNDQQSPLVGAIPEHQILGIIHNQAGRNHSSHKSERLQTLRRQAAEQRYQLAPVHLAVFDRDWILLKKYHNEPINQSVHLSAWLFGLGVLLLIICFALISFYFILRKFNRMINTVPDQDTLVYSPAMDMGDERAIKQVLVEANQVLHRLAHIDALTGVSNRRAFDFSLAQAWQKASKYHEPIALVMIDVDCFKAYNDRYGHKAGDECLQKVAQVLRLEVRRMSDIVARYGGEEFALILPNTPLHDASKIAWNLRQRVFDLQIPHQGSTVLDVVTISCGVACIWPSHGYAQDDLLRRADQALYKAKRAGRNTVEC